MADKELKPSHRSETFRRVRLYYPVLAGCSMDRTPIPDDSESEAAERFYDSTMHKSAVEKGEMQVAVCEFSAGQKLKDVKVLEISATYFVGVRLEDFDASEQEMDAALEEVVAASAWPMFRDLFIHLGSQSGEELPLLPNVPKLRWVDTPKPE